MKEKLWEKGSSANGIFGIKHSGYADGFNKIEAELSSLFKREFSRSASIMGIYTILFPNCKHIFLTRRNKIRQAVSWWKAINDNQWHKESTAPDTDIEALQANFYERHYNFDALLHLWKETNLRECMIQEKFEKYNIAPLTIVYEDFIKNFESTIIQILEFLALPIEGITIQAPYYKKLANAESEKWVQRFRQDLQLNWNKIIW